MGRRNASEMACILQVYIYRCIYIYIYIGIIASEASFLVRSMALNFAIAIYNII